MAHHETSLDRVRVAAQDLHRKVTANIAKAQAGTEAELRIVADEAHKLAQSIKTEAASHTEEVKAHLHTAVVALEAAGANVKANAVTGMDRIHQANAALQEGAHGAAQSVSHAVAILRGTTSIQKPATPRVIA